jgi:DNA recombination protein RmuC
MNIVVIAAILVAMFVFQGVMLWLVLRNRSKAQEVPQQDANSMLLLQNQIEKLERALDSRLNESSKQMNDTMRGQFGESSRLIKEITTELTSVKEIGRQTQTYAEQLQSLQDLLKNPKQRGILGEYYLETVLKNVMSPQDYHIQYAFKNGEIVDAVIVINKKLA